MAIMGQIGSSTEYSSAPAHGFTARPVLLAMWITAGTLTMGITDRFLNVARSRSLISTRMRRGTAAVMSRSPTTMEAASTALDFLAAAIPAVTGNR